MEEYVLTRDELLELFEDSCRLRALEYAGVDNWSGYDYAYEVLDDWGVEDYAEAAEKTLLECSYKKITCDAVDEPDCNEEDC